MKKVVIAVVSTVLVMSLVYVVFFMPARFRLESTSPSGSVVVRGLRFEGHQAHYLDGTLRLYIGGHKRQTTIGWSDKLTISWVADAPVETFEVRQSSDVLMRWRVENDRISCVKGESYLTSDPSQE